MSDPWTIGTAREDEMPRILADWKNSGVGATIEAMREELARLLPEHWQGLAREQVFGRLSHRLYEHYNVDIDLRVLATRPHLLVARDPEDPLFLLGWMACGHVGPVFAIYYAYTREHFRGQGVMKALIEHAYALAPDDAEPVYCVSGPKRGTFERFGFVRKPLHEVLELAAERKTA